jgi:hypothetical protein
MIWKVCRRKCMWSNLNYYPSISQEGTRKTSTEYKYTVCRPWFEPVSPEHEAAMWTTWLWLSVWYFIKYKTPLPEHNVGSCGDVFATIYSEGTLLIWSNLPLFVTCIRILNKVPHLYFKHVIVAIWANGHYHLCTGLQQNRHSSLNCIWTIEISKGNCGYRHHTYVTVFHSYALGIVL